MDTEFPQSNGSSFDVQLLKFKILYCTGSTEITWDTISSAFLRESVTPYAIATPMLDPAFVGFT